VPFSAEERLTGARNGNPNFAAEERISRRPGNRIFATEERMTGTRSYAGDRIYAGRDRFNGTRAYGVGFGTDALYAYRPAPLYDYAPGYSVGATAAPLYNFAPGYVSTVGYARGQSCRCSP